jgi:predicted DNA repair protein MutK
MFLVGGGILVHGLPGTHGILPALAQAAHAVPAIGSGLAAMTPLLLNALAGIVAGGMVLGGVTVTRRLFR